MTFLRLFSKNLIKLNSLIYFGEDMKKLAVLMLVSLLVLAIASGCIQQVQQPTKSSILSALDNANAYTYEFSERRTIQNRTYNIYGVVEVDRKNLHFFGWLVCLFQS